MHCGSMLSCCNSKGCTLSTSQTHNQQDGQEQPPAMQSLLLACIVPGVCTQRLTGCERSYKAYRRCLCLTGQTEVESMVCNARYVARSSSYVVHLLSNPCVTGRARGSSWILQG